MHRKILLAFGLVLAIVLSAAAESANDGGTVIASYAVDSGNIQPATGGPSVDQAVRTRHAAVWRLIASALPSYYLDQITRFDVYIDSSADGAAGDAYTTLSDDGDSWTFAVNWASAKSVIDGTTAELKDFKRTIVHELGHLVSQDHTQMQDGDDDSGQTLEIDGQATKPGAWLNQFYQRFWAKAYPERAGTATTDLDEDAAESFYSSHQADFVTDYAATSVAEDFAESFAVWVLGPRPSRGVAAKKMAFFDGISALAAVRDSLRVSLRD